MTNAKHLATSAAMALALFSMRAIAQTTFSEDFTGTATTNAWYYSKGACLTASTATATTSPGQPPGCTAIASYYSNNSNEVLVGGQNGVTGTTQTLPDPSGSGALRFTNGYPYGKNQAGSIVSATTFPAGQGIQITFKTVTYRGDSGGTGKDGADGIGFFLMDGSYGISVDGTNTSKGLGAVGGSLGFTCSNSNYYQIKDSTLGTDGLIGAYLGLGIDEYGNFLNQGDNTNTGYGFKPNRIGLRGYGNVSWGWLNATYPTLYPSDTTKLPISSASGNSAGTAECSTKYAIGTSANNLCRDRQTAVRNTCRDGVLWDYSGTIPAQAKTTAGATIPVADYATISNAYVVLPTTGTAAFQIAAETAMSRVAATPIFYNLKITQDGLLSLSYSTGGAYISVIKNQNIATSNGTMPASFRFGFAGSTGGSTNIHELLCFKATPATVSASSAGVNEKQAARVEAGTQAYFALYNPNNWTGRLTANTLIDTAGVVTISTVANWDASCVLTGIASGGGCDTTGTTGPVAAQTPSSRVMLTWNGTQGVPFEWPTTTTTGTITTAQQTTLTAGDTTATANRLNYLRGDRSNEINSAGVGLYRARDSVLADIVDSSPVWSGPPSSPYTGNWVDRLHTSDTIPESSATQSYAAFVAARQTRLNVVFAGANDGFLHGFRAGSFDVNGNFVNNATTPNDGQEVLAFMPNTVLNTIHNTTDWSLDFSSSQYGHSFYVDGTPGTGDLYYGGTWHTWLVGGLGAGGAAIYALDVTDTSATNFAESNASNLVIGEWTASNITCTGVTGCGANLANTHGTPVIRRLHNGMWAVLFGSGVIDNSTTTSHDAGLFIMTVDPTTAAKTFYYLSTGVSSCSGVANGIAYVTPSDLDGDHITDYVYAGDMCGNVWRFDLTSDAPGSWAAGSAPLFTTPSGQPITTRVLAIGALGTASGSPMMMIEFGTGQRNQLTNLNPATYASGTQSFYGIWDWNLSGWNNNSSSKFASLAATNAATGLTSPYTITCSSATSCTNLTRQTFTVNTTTGVRDGTNNVVCWRGVTLCASGNNQFGWYVTLPGTAEQLVFNPVYYQGAFIANSTVPANNTPTSCTVTADSGFTYAIAVTNGGTFPSVFPQYNDTNAAGVQTDASGSPYIVTTSEGITNLVYQNVNGTIGGGSGSTKKDGNSTEVNLPNNIKAKRLTWIQLR